MPEKYTRIAILEKQGLFAVIAGDFDVPNGDQPIHLTANFDPRSPEKPVFRSSHPTAADGRRWPPLLRRIRRRLPRSRLVRPLLRSQKLWVIK